MSRNTVARRLKTALLVALVPASAALAAPQAISSADDANWRAQQTGVREWTREEMMSARSRDLPGVSEAKLAQWAADSMSRRIYDTKGGPGMTPGAMPGGAAQMAASEPAIEPTSGGIKPLAGGYTYPAPFTRYESFPSTATGYTTYPYVTVGKVFFTIPGEGNFVCSAASIGGDAVLTAGHCIHSGYHPTSSNFFTNWVFVPGYKNGSAPYGQWAADHLWIRSAFIDDDGGDFRYDEGGAVLVRKAGVKISQKVGYLGFAWNQPTGSTSAHFALLGYPQSAPFNGKTQQVCQASYAYSAGGAAPNPIGVGCDQTGGVSGGPWIRNFAGTAVNSNYENGLASYRRCYDVDCNSLYTQELFSPYFDNGAKTLKDCLVASTPGHPANCS